LADSKELVGAERPSWLGSPVKKRAAREVMVDAIDFLSGIAFFAN
jgi:hypothetical protein